jgi:hypothetical protein
VNNLMNKNIDYINEILSGCHHTENYISGNVLVK